MNRPGEPPDRELKKRSPRFQLDPPLIATFGNQPATIFNIGERGIQLECPEKVPPNTVDTLRFSLPTSPRVIRAKARVQWCRVAKKDDSLKSWPYRCGLQIDGIAALTLETLAQMIELSLAHPLPSMPKTPPQRPTPRPVEDLPRASWVPSPPMSLDQTISLVESARKEVSRLTEAQRDGLASEGRRRGEGSFSEEIFAIYAYLNNALEPRVISMVFEITALEE